MSSSSTDWTKLSFSSSSTDYSWRLYSKCKYADKCRYYTVGSVNCDFEGGLFCPKHKEHEEMERVK